VERLHGKVELILAASVMLYAVLNSLIPFYHYVVGFGIIDVLLGW